MDDPQRIPWSEKPAKQRVKRDRFLRDLSEPSVRQHEALGGGWQIQNCPPYFTPGTLIFRTWFFGSRSLEMLPKLSVQVAWDRAHRRLPPRPVSGRGNQAVRGNAPGHRQNLEKENVAEVGGLPCSVWVAGESPLDWCRAP